MLTTFTAPSSNEKGARGGATVSEKGEKGGGGREKEARGAEDGACSDGSVEFDSSTCVNEKRGRELGSGREKGREEGEGREGQEAWRDGSKGEIEREIQQRGFQSSVSQPSDLLSCCSRCCTVQGKEEVPTGLSRIVPYCWLLLYVLTSAVIWVLIVLYSVYNTYSDTAAPSLIKHLDITILWSVAFAPAGAVLRYSLWHVPVFTPYVTRKVPTLKVPTLAANLSGSLFLALCSVLAPHSLYSIAFSSGECGQHRGCIEHDSINRAGDVVPSSYELLLFTSFFPRLLSLFFLLSLYSLSLILSPTLSHGHSLCTSLTLPSLLTPPSGFCGSLTTVSTFLLELHQLHVEQSGTHIDTDTGVGMSAYRSLRYQSTALLTVGIRRAWCLLFFLTLPTIPFIHHYLTL
jgi:fluoride ion exporter CrcB/FEX